MASTFTASELNKIHKLFDTKAERFDYPRRRNHSVLLATFNIRKLGEIQKRPSKCWSLLVKSMRSFDLIAVQEIMDNIEGIEHLKQQLGPSFGLVISDVTGVYPGSRGNAERLGFLYNRNRIEHTALASDITVDRSEVANTLFENRQTFSRTFEHYQSQLEAWQQENRQRKSQGKRKKPKPPLELPRFVTFIRQPLCASFRVKGKNGADPYEFLAINAHLLYGTNKEERQWEFFALIEWLTIRSKKADTLYHPNLLLLGDCNLDFDTNALMREQIDSHLKALNKSVLKSMKAAKANFPLLSTHPTKGILRTNLRQEQTYDQIGLFVRDTRLPLPEANATAGASNNSYDYGVFNLADLLAQALYTRPFAELNLTEKNHIISRAEHDISDHMPAWIRLPIPAS